MKLIEEKILKVDEFGEIKEKHFWAIYNCGTGMTSYYEQDSFSLEKVKQLEKIIN